MNTHDRRGYSTGPGWWKMLDEELAKVPGVEFSVKEKYGRCDITFYDGNEELFAIEDRIEERSLQMCEFCGLPGKLREDREYIQTLCDFCADLNPLDRRKVAEKTKLMYFMNQTLKDVFFEVHAVYEPDGSDTPDGKWYCAAVDLFRPGMTFRVYFTWQDDESIYVEHVERWYFG